MPGLFQALETGKRALLTHQITLQTIGHNIANVNTPGYTRQRVNFSSSSPEVSSLGAIGTGIQVDDIRHIRDLFLGEQYREATKSLGEWGYQQKSLEQVESLFNEPNDATLNNLLDKFWDSWSELSTNPDSPNNRQLVLTQAQQMINRLHQLSREMTDLRNSTDQDLVIMTDEVNQLTSEIAILNQQIKGVEIGNDHANDLRDRRDLLINQLSQVIDVNVIKKTNGAVSVTMGSMVLVDESSQFAIDTKALNADGVSTNKLVWKSTNIQLTNRSGEMAGLTRTRDVLLPNYMSKLDALARGIVEQVNSLHRSGYGVNGTTDVPFFDISGLTASTIKLNDAVAIDVNKIATASVTTGDNKIALAIAGLRTSQVMEGNTLSLNDFYNGFIGSLGVEVNQANSSTANYQLLRQQVDEARQSVEGVSLDEEMANMVKYQHSYDAAARVITAMDQALDTVINGMGVVGR